MSGFRNLREYGDALTGGAVRDGHFRKVPSQASVAGWWVDLSMAAGNPPPNYYASDPLVAATLSGFRGIFHGDAVAPAVKQLHSLTLCTPTAGLVGTYNMLDYLLYYPFVDMDAAGDTQLLDNTVTLPRYTDGRGVQVMAVAVTPTAGGGSFTYDYVDHNGDAKTSPTISLSTAAASIASIVTSEPATAAGGRPFLPQASGSDGVQQITAVNVIVAGGGLVALVLVKPIARHTIREVNVPSEVEYFVMRQGAPAVEDDAYLNLVMNCAATVAAGTLAGHARFVFTGGGSQD